MEFPRKSILNFVKVPQDFEDLENTENQIKCFLSWKNDKLTRTHYYEYLKFFQMNPQVKFFLFDDYLQDKWMETFFGNHKIFTIYKGIKFEASKSDIFRLCLLKKYGGVFIGINRVLDKPICELVTSNQQFVLTFEKNYFKRDKYPDSFPNEYRDFSVVQHTIIASKNHKIIDMGIERIVAHAPQFNKVIFQSPKNAIWNFSAPYLLTQAVDSYIEQFGFKGIELQGFDFNGCSRIPNGAQYRYAFSPSYLGAKGQSILDYD
jgi:mannosyltransferase OCH1-like enzyme